MVEWPSRRGFPVPRFIEDFGVFGILWREFLFHLLSYFCQGGREGESLDMGMVLSKYSSEGCSVPLLGINLSGIFRFISFNCSKIL